MAGRPKKVPAATVGRPYPSVGLPAYIQRGHSLDEHRRWGTGDLWDYRLQIGVILVSCVFIAVIVPVLSAPMAVIGGFLTWLIDTRWDNAKPIREQHPRQIRRFMRDQEHRLKMDEMIRRVARETMPPAKPPRPAPTNKTGT